MKIKSLISCFAVSLMVFSIFSDVKAQSNTKTLTLQSPADIASYIIGDTVVIKWSADFSVSRYQPVTINLLAENSKRYRIGYVTRSKSNGLYTLNWKIPENFFEKKKIKSDSVDFKIEIRMGGNIKNRLISSKYLIKIQKISQPQSEQSGNITTSYSNPDTNQTNVNLPQNSQHIARYEFKSLLEPWVVKKLTVVNDTQNDGFDPDPAETTDAIDKVYIRYPDETGTLIIKSIQFANGKATFSGLDFYIPKRASAYLDLYATPVDPNIFGANFSGKTFRLGIQDSANNSSTFEATGQISSATVNSPGTLLATGSSINTYIVREKALTFNVLSPSRQDLFNGESDVFDFSLSSDSASLGRLVFNINQSGLTTLDNAKLYRNGKFLTPGNAAQSGDIYMVWDAGASSCFADIAQNGAGTGMDCNGGTAESAKLIITFSKEEIISGTNDYKLYFNINGAENDDNLTVRINHNDDSAQPIIAGSDKINGKIYNSGSGLELFTNPTDFVNEATAITDRNIIWSDRSADLHSYTTITPAPLPTTDTGSSADWSNGYLLYLNALPAVTSVR